MKGIILAGGLGTRLHPLTRATNKHLLPVGREPMLYHAIRQLTGAGIGEILVITSTSHMGDVVRCLGSGDDFGCHLSYKVQESAAGIAHALALAEDFARGEKICVILGDNVFEFAIAPYAAEFAAQESGARVLL
ncbi:MAG: NTP transferase domain-containing protein, partial [Gammaproteobacteria bacterium]|nr:NTP transferase domain-containing protein [Gammaproteobacteria bacterium]